jgi:hypothetical protein
MDYDYPFGIFKLNPEKLATQVIQDEEKQS